MSISHVSNDEEIWIMFRCSWRKRSKDLKRSTPLFSFDCACRTDYVRCTREGLRVPLSLSLSPSVSARLVHRIDSTLFLTRPRDGGHVSATLVQRAAAANPLLLVDPSCLTTTSTNSQIGNSWTSQFHIRPFKALPVTTLCRGVLCKRYTLVTWLWWRGLWQKFSIPRWVRVKISNSKI